MEWCCHNSEAFAAFLQCSSEVRCVTDCTTGMAVFTAKQNTYLKKGSGLRCVLWLSYIS